VVSDIMVSNQTWDIKSGRWICNNTNNINHYSAFPSHQEAVTFSKLETGSLILSPSKSLFSIIGRTSLTAWRMILHTVACLQSAPELLDHGPTWIIYPI
jgi:hypothetical protein